MPANRLLVLFFVTTALCLGTLATRTVAQVPDTMSVQIFVTDTTGVPLDSTGGGVNIRFYQGASLRYSNFVNNVTFVGGVATLDLDVAAFAFDRDYDMAILMGGVEFLPRTPLRSVPYALSLRGLRVFPAENGTYGVSPNLLGGGKNNRTRADVVGAMIGGGGTTHAGPRNQVLDHFGTVGGGLGNHVGADTSALGTAFGAAVLGGQNNKALSARAGIVAGLSNLASGSQSFVGSGSLNEAKGRQSAISGGSGNVASARNSAVVGGDGNVSSGNEAFVGGGEGNVAAGTGATVGGGYFNFATQNHATVPGGRSNAARGLSSFAAGLGAKADHSHSFIWNDATSEADSFHTSAANQFVVRARGGLHYWHEDSLVVTSDARGLIPGADGAYNLGTSAMRWDTVFAINRPFSVSDGRLKSDIADIDYGLGETLALRPVTYRMKTNPDGRRQIGLIAQEVLGVVPEVVISSQSGYAMQYSSLIPLLISAIQDQQKLILEQSARIDALEVRVDQ
jgi:hypothetical protein